MMPTGNESLELAEDHDSRWSGWSDRLLRAVIASAPTPIMVKDADGRYLAANPAAARSVGLHDATQVIGRTVYDFFPGSLADQLSADDAEVLHNGQTKTAERRAFLAHEGAVAWLETTRVPIKDASGEVLAIIVLTRDATQDAIAAKELDTERSLLYSIIDAVPDFIFVKDREGRYVTVNESFYSALGACAREEIIGAKDGDYHTKELAKRFVADDEHVMSSGEPKLAYEEPHIDARGVHRWLSTSKVPLRDEDGSIQGVVGIARDVTGQKEVEERLTQARKLESIGQLAAGIAHEINTPAQYVTDNAKFAKDALETLLNLVRLQETLLNNSTEAPLEPEDVKRWRRAAEQADLDYLLEELPASIEESLDGLSRIAGIVQSMKEFSHPDAEQMQFSDINRAIQSTLTVATSEWKHVADVNTNFDEELPRVKCHLGSLNQVMLNLIVNAAQALSQGTVNDGAKGRIEISTRALGDQIEIQVCDNGPGMSPKVKERIFDPFFTTKEVGSGSGQGLALANATIVKQHHGTIAVDSTPGAGATFTIRLPVTPPEADEVSVSHVEADRAH